MTFNHRTLYNSPSTQAIVEMSYDDSDGPSELQTTILADNSTNTCVLRPGYQPKMKLNIWNNVQKKIWSNRTWLERTLMILLSIAIILIAILFERSPQIEPVETEFELCQTPSCIYASNEILNSIDSDLDPCDDFYKFSCSKWEIMNPLPDGKSIWGAFGKLDQKNQLIVKHELDRLEKRSSLSNAEQKALNFYQSCMDDNDIIDKLGDRPLHKIIKDGDGWNLTKSDFDLDKFILQQSLEFVQLDHFQTALFAWGVAEDDRNSSQYVIQLDQGGLTLPSRDNYINRTEHSEILKSYSDYIEKVATLLDNSTLNVKEQVKSLIEFETRLAEITIPKAEQRDQELQYRSVTIKELNQIVNFIDWLDFFQHAFRRVNMTVTEEEKIVIYSIEYFKNLCTLLKEYGNSAKKRIVLKNYLMWQVVRGYVGYLSKPFRDAGKPLRKALLGSDGSEESWRFCVSETISSVGYAISSLFVRAAFNGRSKPASEVMINNVRTAFMEHLKLLDWMAPETKIEALDKANAISDMIGYPEFILDTKKLDEKYDGLEFNASEYFENNVRLAKFDLRKNLERLKERKVDRNRWGMSPIQVNAYYTPTKNQIVFPAAILQSPFYDLNNPLVLNYGSMGVVMGHEMTHAFDDQGRAYDRYGNLHQWWSNETLELFKEKSNCFVEEYDSYTINNRSVNGKLTLGENIADNGGLKAAYHAYEKLRTPEISKLRLPGLQQYNDRQLFFIAFAQVWCTTITNETINLLIEKDTHSPYMYRVNGAVSNLKEFATTFNCPKDSKMNPKKKCEIW